MDPGVAGTSSISDKRIRPRVTAIASGRPNPFSIVVFRAVHSASERESLSRIIRSKSHQTCRPPRSWEISSGGVLNPSEATISRALDWSWLKPGTACPSVS